MTLTIFQLSSLVLATATTLFVLAEYMVLVPLRRNPGAQRLTFLLAAVAALLILTVARILWGDYPGRLTVLAVFFYALAAAMARLGWHIWRDQTEGARRWRREHTDTTRNGDQ